MGPGWVFGFLSCPMKDVLFVLAGGEPVFGGDGFGFRL